MAPFRRCAASLRRCAAYLLGVQAATGLGFLPIACRARGVVPYQTDSEKVPQVARHPEAALAVVFEVQGWENCRSVESLVRVDPRQKSPAARLAFEALSVKVGEVGLQAPLALGGNQRTPSVHAPRELGDWQLLVVAPVAQTLAASG